VLFPEIVKEQWAIQSIQPGLLKFCEGYERSDMIPYFRRERRNHAGAFHREICERKPEASRSHKEGTGSGERNRPRYEGYVVRLLQRDGHLPSPFR
jgi:hypothetical protein